MLSIEEARIQLRALKGKPKFQRMLHFSAILTSLLEQEQIRPVIVGGFSVEIYTRSEYTTSDVDFILNGRSVAARYLDSLGFQKLGKDWFHRELELAMEIPDNLLAGNYEKVTKILLENSQYVYVIGIEDIILDRLRAFVHWQSSRDGEWAERLFLTHRNRVDVNYLAEQSKKDGTDQLVQGWLQLEHRNEHEEL
ncbi:nucleotidyltransferase [Paenibacillus turpanensis]|uniref:nucleotidyltransferase n=1 Tax=Paenibacillus turpanensis TaxID=2689078 RepID=UPI00140AA69C|nr:nucleotidyltransferase [Paenibacillus turpanensis]